MGKPMLRATETMHPSSSVSEFDFLLVLDLVCRFSISDLLHVSRSERDYHAALHLYAYSDLEPSKRVLSLKFQTESCPAVYSSID